MNETITINADSDLCESTSQPAQHVTFYVGGLMMAIPINQVQEINRHLDVTRVPHGGANIRGVINLRGEVVSVIDLPRVLGFGSAEVSAKSRNVIIHHEEEQIGLIVDDIADILSILKSDVRAAPANVKGVEGRFFKGVYTTETQIAVILDVNEVLCTNQEETCI
jgi:purine-binding chemotaxis protein CheW